MLFSSYILSLLIITLNYDNLRFKRMISVSGFCSNWENKPWIKVHWRAFRLVDKVVIEDGDRFGFNSVYKV